MSTYVDYSTNLALEPPWFAVKVRSRSEETIAAALREKQYEVLNPSSTELRQYSDRVRKASCALFPGYLFVAMAADKLLPLVSTEGVQYVVRSGSSIQPLPDRELKSIRLLCQMDPQQSQSCRPCAYLRVGQKVRIEMGPLAGLEGVLVRAHDARRVVVTVESLHSSVSIEIGHTQISLLEASVEANKSIHVSNTIEPSPWSATRRLI